MFLYIFVLLMLFVGACKSPAKSGVNISFYYWKTQFQLNSFEKDLLIQNDVKRLYVRYFDINLIRKNDANTALPQAVISFEKQDIPQGIEIIPVVYIKNKVMENATINLDSLAKNTGDLINLINTQNNITIHHIQLDCDWSLETKDRFFDFIEKLKTYTKIDIGSTLRLHQVKYYGKTGIPDVDTPVLMYYNMLAVNANGHNAIYDQKTASRYNGSLANYPKPLNVAIPIYSWFVHSRSGTIIELFSKKPISTIKENEKLNPVSDHIFEVKENHIFWGTYLKKGDLLKYDAVSKSGIRTILEDLNEYLNSPPTEIILYDLDELNFKNQAYEKDFFKQEINHIW